MYFKTAPEGSTRQEVNENHLDRIRPGTMTLEEGIEAFNTRKNYATFGSTFFFLDYPDDMKNVMDFEGRMTGTIGVGLQRNSELKSAFNYHISKMRELGVLDKLNHHWIKKDRPKDMSERIFTQDIVVLGFENLFLPANILACGIISGLIIAVLEKLRVSKMMSLSMLPQSTQFS